MTVPFQETSSEFNANQSKISLAAHLCFRDFMSRVARVR